MPPYYLLRANVNTVKTNNPMKHTVSLALAENPEHATFLHSDISDDAQSHTFVNEGFDFILPDSITESLSLFCNVNEIRETYLVQQSAVLASKGSSRRATSISHLQRGMDGGKLKQEINCVGHGHLKLTPQLISRMKLGKCYSYEVVLLNMESYPETPLDYDSSTAEISLGTRPHPKLRNLPKSKNLSELPTLQRSTSPIQNPMKLQQPPTHSETASSSLWSPRNVIGSALITFRVYQVPETHLQPSMPRSLSNLKTSEHQIDLRNSPSESKNHVLSKAGLNGLLQVNVFWAENHAVITNPSKGAQNKDSKTHPHSAKDSPQPLAFFPNRVRVQATIISSTPETTLSGHGTLFSDSSTGQKRVMFTEEILLNTEAPTDILMLALVNDEESEQSVDSHPFFSTFLSLASVQPSRTYMIRSIDTATQTALLFSLCLAPASLRNEIHQSESLRILLDASLRTPFNNSQSTLPPIISARLVANRLKYWNRAVVNGLDAGIARGIAGENNAFLAGYPLESFPFVCTTTPHLPHIGASSSSLESQAPIQVGSSSYNINLNTARQASIPLPPPASVSAVGFISRGGWSLHCASVVNAQVTRLADVGFVFEFFSPTISASTPPSFSLQSPFSGPKPKDKKRRDSQAERPHHIVFVESEHPETEGCLILQGITLIKLAHLISQQIDTKQLLFFPFQSEAVRMVGADGPYPSVSIQLGIWSNLTRDDVIALKTRPGQNLVDNSAPRARKIVDPIMKKGKWVSTAHAQSSQPNSLSNSRRLGQPNTKQKRVPANRCDEAFTRGYFRMVPQNGLAERDDLNRSQPIAYHAHLLNSSQQEDMPFIRNFRPPSTAPPQAKKRRRLAHSNGYFGWQLEPIPDIDDSKMGSDKSTNQFGSQAGQLHDQLENDKGGYIDVDGQYRSYGQKYGIGNSQIHLSDGRTNWQNANDIEREANIINPRDEFERKRIVETDNEFYLRRALGRFQKACEAIVRQRGENQRLLIVVKDQSDEIERLKRIIAELEEELAILKKKHSTMTLKQERLQKLISSEARREEQFERLVEDNMRMTVELKRTKANLQQSRNEHMALIRTIKTGDRDRYERLLQRSSLLTDRVSALEVELIERTKQHLAEVSELEATIETLMMPGRKREDKKEDGPLIEGAEELQPPPKAETKPKKVAGPKTSSKAASKAVHSQAKRTPPSSVSGSTASTPTSRSAASTSVVESRSAGQRLIPKLKLNEAQPKLRSLSSDRYSHQAQGRLDPITSARPIPRTDRARVDSFQTNDLRDSFQTSTRARGNSEQINFADQFKINPSFSPSKRKVDKLNEIIQQFDAQPTAQPKKVQRKP